MNRLDKRYLIAIGLTTLLMVVSYLALIAIGQNYANNMTATLGGVEKAPLIVIGTFLKYWWIGYVVMIASLTLRWGIKRVSNNY